MATVRRKQQKTTATRKRKSKARVSPPAPPRPRRPPPQICRFDESKVGFGDLPAELRNQIYELALIPSSGAAIRIVQQPPGVAGEDIALGLLASCKAVRKEAWSFFYERNEFRVDCVYQERRCSYEMDISHGVQWRDHIVFDGKVLPYTSLQDLPLVDLLNLQVTIPRRNTRRIPRRITSKTWTNFCPLRTTNLDFNRSEA